MWMLPRAQTEIIRFLHFVNGFIFISKVVNLFGLIIGGMPDSSFGECPGRPLKMPTSHRFRSTGWGGGIPPG